MRSIQLCLAGIGFLCTVSLAAATLPSTVKIEVDGRDELHFLNNNLQVNHYSWGNPANLYVDGVAKPLVFSANSSNLIPLPASGDYWVKKVAGRDGGYAVQTSDGFILAAVDNPLGSDSYLFQFASVPGPDLVDWMHVTTGPKPTLAHSFAGLAGYTAGVQDGTTTTVTLTVDGSDELQFVKGQLVIHHLSWNVPSSLKINGQLQTLTWNSGVSNPVALNLPDQFVFSQGLGRSRLYAVDTAAGLMVSAADEYNGSDVYQFTLAAVPEPSPIWACVLVGGWAHVRGRRRDPLGSVLGTLRLR